MKIPFLGHSFFLKISLPAICLLLGILFSATCFGQNDSLLVQPKDSVAPPATTQSRPGANTGYKINSGAVVDTSKQAVSISQPLVNDTSTLVATNDTSKQQPFLNKIIPPIVREVLHGRDSQPPIPRVALIRSAVLPGWGQIYNRHYWKLPLVYGVLGGMGYLAIRQNTSYQIFSRAYRADTDSNATTSASSILQNGGINNNYVDGSYAEGLRSSRNQARDSRDQILVYGFVVYGLHVLEAYIDAQLQAFDLSENLSLKIQPSLMPIRSLNATSYRPSLGLSIRF